MTRDPGERPFDVLVVDDEDFVRETLSLYLEGEGCRVRTAGGGEEALRIAADAEIEAAVVDIRMPGMDGLTLLSELKRRHPDVEVLMATGFQSLETAVEAMRRGACDYITKPITDLENDLLRFVLRAVERRRLRLRHRELSHRLQSALDELAGLRGLARRDAIALGTIEEFGRRTLRASRTADVLDALADLLPRIAPAAGAAVQLAEGGRPAVARTIGPAPEPFPTPPAPPAPDTADERWVERPATGGDATELWLPLAAAGENRGWLLLRTEASGVEPATRLALRALADQLALSLAALASEPTRSVDTTG